MSYTAVKTISNKFLGAFIAASFLTVLTAVLLLPASVQSAIVDNRSLRLSTSLPGAQATYQVAFTAPAQPLLGSIKVEFCSNSPLIGDVCVPPAGFNVLAAALAAQSGETGFTVHSSTTSNILVMSRTPAPSANIPTSYTLTNVQSAGAAGSQYARYVTYAEDDASGVILDSGGIAYSLNDTFGVTTEVPPRLEFCIGTSILGVSCSGASGSYVALGDFSHTDAAKGQMQMVIGTNAGNGYTIRVNGNTLTSGNNAIQALASPTFSAPGNNQFGINLRANGNPTAGADPSGPGSGQPEADYNMPNRYTFRPGDVIASKNTVEDYRKYTVTYLVNISRTQPPGIYSGTYTYVALGNF